MAARIHRVLQYLRSSLEQFQSTLFGSHPPFGPALVVEGSSFIDNDACGQSDGGLSSIFDGILWAVPKHRRSIQRNRTRRRAKEKLTNYIPQWKFTTCEVCGHTRMNGFLCGHCLIRIRQETAEIRKLLFEEPSADGVIPEKENVVLYKDETPRPEDAGKKIFEVKKKRPLWFSRALLE